MNIELKNKFLYFQKYKLRCAIGKRGISLKKREGDNKTPKGTFSLKFILYRKDRITKLKTKLKKIIIKKNMGWCDSPSSKFYNQLISFPFKNSAERLWLRGSSYDVVIVINYNLKPVKKKQRECNFFTFSKKKISSY